MASRQVMRSVSADFCASAGAAMASVVPAANSAPRSQVSNRMIWSFHLPKLRSPRGQTMASNPYANVRVADRRRPAMPVDAVARPPLLPARQIEARQIVLEALELQL